MQWVLALAWKLVRGLAFVLGLPEQLGIKLLSLFWKKKSLLPRVRRARRMAWPSPAQTRSPFGKAAEADPDEDRGPASGMD